MAFTDTGTRAGAARGDRDAASRRPAARGAGGARVCACGAARDARKPPAVAGLPRRERPRWPGPLRATRRSPRRAPRSTTSSRTTTIWPSASPGGAGEARRSDTPETANDRDPRRALLSGRPHPRAARPAAARAPLRRRGADPERGARRAKRRPALGGADPAHQARGDRGRPVGRAARARARRPGLVDHRLVPRRGAARALHERPLLVHPERLQRAGERHARADRPLPAPGAPRRAARRLRGHRGRGGLRPVRHRRPPRARPTAAG